MADRVIIHGEPGTTWVNESDRVRYQFICAFIHTCGACLQYHMAIGPWWPIKLHYRCRCTQVAIRPGGTAPHAFADFRAILDDMSYADKREAIGASNYKLLKAGVVTWDEIVSKFRVRTLREVIALNKVSFETAVKAGVPKRAYVAWGEGVEKRAAVKGHAFGQTGVHSPEQELLRQERARLIENIKGAGVSQEALVDALSRGIVSKVELVAPGVKQSMAPFVARRAGDLLAAELAALYPPGPPEPPEPPPAGPAPAPVPVPPPAPLPQEPAAPTEPVPEKKPRKPRVVKPRAFEKHDMGASKATVKFEPGSRAAVNHVFGKPMTARQLASLAGAPDDARVVVSERSFQVELTVSHPKIDHMQRTVRKEAGKIVIHNDIFMLKDEFQESAGKLGLRAFAREVQHAQAMGVDRIETYAHRVKGSVNPTTGKEKWSGYYVWPRFGYEGPIPDYIKELPEWRLLSPELQGSKMVSELIGDPVGRKWWQKHGDAINVEFDPKPGSYSMNILNEYLKETIPVVK